MIKTNIIDRWYADLYDQEETQTNDIDFLISVIGNSKQNILEVCCGSGRILVPLAKQGHTVTGFDMDSYMLERIHEKAKGLDNICFSAADAVKDDWGQNYDIVVMAGNILINIVSDMDYREAQKLFITKAYQALKGNGHLYMDFNCFTNPESFFNDPLERVIFEGRDSFGNFGRYSISESSYDPNTQITEFKRKTQIITADGEKVERENVSKKYIPKLEQVHEWLYEAGFWKFDEYGDYIKKPLSGSAQNVVIWAEKQL